MKRYIKILIIFFLFIFLIVFFSVLLINTDKKKPVSNSSQNSGSLILGFSQIGSESAWRTRNTESVFEAAKENNIQIIFDDAQQKQANQLKAIRSFIVYQVDVIAFVPIVEDGWDNVLQEAKDANIPVIIVDRMIDTDPSLYAGFLGEDAYEEGRSAARFLINKCRYSPKEQINILEVSGTPNASVAISRAEGFRSLIEKDEKFKLIYSVDGDFLRSRGKEIMDNILAESHGTLSYDNQPIDVIFSHNDSMTLGLLDSMRANNISTRKPIIISIDAEQKSINALITGDLNCVVECNPNLGEALMTLVQKITNGEAIPRVTYINETVFSEYDDFSRYEPRGY